MIRRFALLAAVGLVAANCSSSAGTSLSTAAATTAPAATTQPATTGSTSTNPASSSPGGTSATTLQVSADQPCGVGGVPPAEYDHVIWIWMENHSARQVLGKADAPYETALAAKCGTAADYHSVGTPSLPNYLGATSGDTWGIADDAAPASHPLTVDNIFRQVRDTNRTAMSFEEDMPSNCSLKSGGTYAVKHNPAAYYVGANDRVACGTDNVPLDTADDGAFQTMLANGSLPAFSFITPNMCHDTHDCSVNTGDQWLAGFVPLILSSATYRAGRTAVFLVWDEDAPMPFMAIAPTVPNGAVVTARVDHYALLRTTEDMLGLGHHLAKATTAPSMRATLDL